MLKDPKEFSCTDDAPINNGSNQEDYNPPRRWREEMDGEGVEDEESMQDLWDNFSPNENG